MTGFKSLLCGVLIFLSLSTFAQEYPHELKQYPFIQYDSNRLEFFGDSTHWLKIFDQFDSIVFDGTGQLDVLHMGGSHIQAGVFSAQMRKHLQTIQPGLNSYRGFLFPYRLAKTNNPRNYSVTYTGSWEGCRNVQKSKNCTLGLAGISATTTTAGATLKIKFDPDYMEYPYSQLKVFHMQDSNQFEIVPSDRSYSYRYDTLGGFSEFSFSAPQDSLFLTFSKKEEFQSSFTLLGLKFENEDTGFAYHSIGVNGADVPAYLRCDLLSQHSGVVQPDLVILSIGINDAHTAYFKPEFFKDNYDKLIEELKENNPDLRIIFTTNNDSYYRRRYVNKNGEKVQKAMKELAEKHNAAVWDLYEIMGGLDSIKQWESFGLAQGDKIHFTRAGYELVGDLFFSALIKSYEKHIMEN